jgi:uncharacterized protein YjiS (DUF1127 family)
MQNPNHIKHRKDRTMTMIATLAHSHKDFGISKLANTVTGLFETRRQRAQLKSLSWSQLADLGLSDKQALAESRRPLWDLAA